MSPQKNLKLSNNNNNKNLLHQGTNSRINFAIDNYKVEWNKFSKKIVTLNQKFVRNVVYLLCEMRFFYI